MANLLNIHGNTASGAPLRVVAMGLIVAIALFLRGKTSIAKLVTS